MTTDRLPTSTTIEWAELDMANSRRFGELLGDALQAAAREGQRTLPLDLSAVEFMDSQAVRELVIAAREGAVVGVHLALHGTRAPVRRLLDLTGVSTLVTVAAAA